MLNMSCRKLSQRTFDGRYNQTWTRQSLSFEYAVTVSEACEVAVGRGAGLDARAIIAALQQLPATTLELWLGNWVETLALLVARKAARVPTVLLSWGGCHWNEED